MAIRNGFGRATTTIVDANVTTLITAIVLYAIGTDQIRGFAVTLILGILMSMFTAIFCSRIIFDLAEKSRRLTSLKMMQLVGTTQIDFIGKRVIAAVFSVVLITAGIVGLTLRGADIFDIDFRGGTSVHLTLNKGMETDEIRKLLGPKFEALRKRYTISALNSGASESNKVFKVDSALEKVEELQDVIQEALSDSLATYSLEYGEMRSVSVAGGSATDESTTGTSADDATPENEVDDPPAKTPATDQPPTEDATPAVPAKETEEEPVVAPSSPASEPEMPPGSPPTADENPTPPADGAPGADAPPPAPTPSADGEPPAGDDAQFWPSTDNQLAMVNYAAATLIGQAEPDATPTESPDTSQPPANETDPPAEPTGTAEEPSNEEPAIPNGDEASTTDPTPALLSRSEVDLTLEHAINYDTLRAEITKVMEKIGQPVAFELQNPKYTGGSNAFKAWTLEVSYSQAQTQVLLSELTQQFESKPVWQSSNKIGSTVAGRMQSTAIVALLASLLGIILYIWIRFQRVIFGLAAVVALVHDVLVTLGAIALSYWLAGIFGFLLIEEFKISLPIVAALLTIIGYSLNDTIVVFDRIREVRGKSPELTGDMINKSINQTLSRTLLTSFTTLLVVLILYCLGGDGIHGFAFALVVGVTVGTYSSIFVASPVLLWMTPPKKAGQRSKAT
jgi:SecD/SecF fusion protein